MKNNRSGSALLIGMFVTIIIVIIAIYLLEKIVPFSRDIKGVENGNISYYRANTALNEALLSMSGGTPWYETGSSASLYVNGSGMIYTVTATGKVLPQSGKGNSEYDENWAILAPGKPIQLILKSNPINWTTTTLNFRVPNLDNNNSTPEALAGGAILPVINWALTASGDTLQASGSQIMAGIASSGSISFDDTPYKNGLTLSGSADTFANFYTAKCIGSDICTLKISLINPLILTTGESTPYLEYQAQFDVPVPLQTAVIETQGYAGGFRKNITRFIQQMTTNEALDFTVFQ